MIVSHRHHFVFLKTRRAAGSTLQALLASICGPWDIITPMVYPPSGYKARNYRFAQGGHATSWTVSHLSHLAHWELEKLLPGIQEDYWTFAFDRNPWDKAVSHWRWFFPEQTTPREFRKWAQQRYQGRIDQPLYAPDKTMVFRFEELQQSVNAICKRLTVSRLHVSRKLKATRRRKYRSYYDEETQERVHEANRDLIARLDYVF